MRKVIYKVEMQSLNLCVQDSLLPITAVFAAGDKNSNTASRCSISPLAFNHRIPVYQVSAVTLSYLGFMVTK